MRRLTALMVVLQCYAEWLIRDFEQDVATVRKAVGA